MMKLFRLKNKSKNCWWIISENLDVAKNDSVEYGYAKDIKNIKLVGDQTEFYLKENGSESLNNLLNSNISGVAYIVISTTNRTWQISNKHRKLI